jgi:hypothetical protein
VLKEFREYLRCGILAHGFLRCRCESCHNEHLVAFSCKRRGFCPSCGGRRMAESAAHLVDEVLPVKPVRQWVLSFPVQIRLLLAIRPKIMSEILNIATNTITGHLIKKAGFKKSSAKTGSVTLIQRFGGSINLNVHFHQLYLDGVYELDTDGRPKEFHITKAPTRSELAEVLQKIIARITKLLEKRGLIERDQEDNLQVSLEEDDALARLQAGATTYRFTLGPNKGKKALTLKTVPENDHNSIQGLVAKNSGFSLHAGVSFTGTEFKTPDDRSTIINSYFGRSAPVATSDHAGRAMPSAEGAAALRACRDLTGNRWLQSLCAKLAYNLLNYRSLL